MVEPKHTTLCPGSVIMTRFSLYLFLLFIMLLSAGCAAEKRLPDNVLSGLGLNEIIAVSYIHEEGTGDITLLGGHLRDLVETALAERGVIVKARKDIVGLIDAAEVTDINAEEKIWRNAGADIFVRGTYSIVNTDLDAVSTGDVLVEILLKAYDYDTVSLVDSDSLNLYIAKERINSLSRITGNIYQREFKTVIGATVETPPRLQARLNEGKTCYGPGDSISIDIDSEVGVYLYIFNLSCDGNVVALCPNDYSPNEPLKKGRFTFPSSDHSHIQEIRLQPAEKGEICRESFKLVAARKKLDFSFLPFPKNRIYRGVNRGDIAKITAILRENGIFSQQLLDYRIDENCGF